MHFTKDSIVSVIVGVLILAIGAALGGMYVKIQFLEGKVSGANTVAAAPTPAAVGPQQPQAPTKVDVKIEADDPVLGDPNAKLTIVTFADYQCPYCGKFFSDIEGQLIKEYVDTGKVKLVFKNLAFLGQESQESANAALCAKEQNKFWEYHDYLFSHQQGENQGAFSVDNLKKFAVTLGLKSDQFNKCLEAKKYDAQVKADIAEANRVGFNSTPSTAVGTVPMIGASPYAQFKTVVDAQLAAAK